MSEPIASDLAGKSVLVTGASTGIGAAAARAFARAGCRVAIHYNASLNRAEEVAADVRFAGAEAFLVGGDLRSSSKAREVVDAVAAHYGGLRGTGSTVAVIGTGADIVYPARNHELAHRIAAEGCIISEYALGTPAIASNFPRRNRIISGLARGVLVIEAAAQSGSLITARVAAEQGRDVFAIPGSIHSPLSKGCHQLIKQGAKLVESAQDVLEELSHIATSVAAPMVQARNRAAQHDAAPSRILRAAGFDPVDPDTLAMRCEIDIAALQAQLLTLLLEGAIEMLPGGMIRRLSTH